MPLQAAARKHRVEEPEAWELPDATRSLCPSCLQVIDAVIHEDDGQVLMRKSCQSHGASTELLSTDAAFFKKLRRTHYEHPAGIENPIVSDGAPCPDGCGLCEKHLSTPALVQTMTSGPRPKTAASR